MNIVSAGLAVTTNNIFNINKTINQDETIVFSLKNTESFTFYNVTFETNNYVTMPKISLSPGETKEVTATVKTNDNINQKLSIIGFYESRVGASNETYNIDVDYDSGLSQCDMTLIKGDSIVWYNRIVSIAGEIKLINADTLGEVTTINSNTTYKTTFDYPMLFRYYFTRYGIKFTDTCEINVLDDVGMIHNKDYDANITLNIKTTHEPTQISVTILQKNYTTKFYGTQEGVLVINNIGSNIAKNINLEGDWFEFSPNNFDLESGYTKSVTYKIKPQVSNSNDTNKTYIKPIKITGNFDDYENNFSVFVEYANIGEIENQTSQQGLIDFIISYCQEHPDICNVEPVIVYRDTNNTERVFNVTYGEEQVKALQELWIEFIDSQGGVNNYVKEKLEKQDSDMESLKQNDDSNTQKVQEMVDMVSTFNGILTFGLFALLPLLSFH